jgi:hypothetical protein
MNLLKENIRYVKIKNDFSDLKDNLIITRRMIIIAKILLII